MCKLTLCYINLFKIKQKNYKNKITIEINCKK